MTMKFNLRRRGAKSGKMRSRGLGVSCAQAQTYEEPSTFEALLQSLSFEHIWAWDPDDGAGGMLDSGIGSDDGQIVAANGSSPSVEATPLKQQNNKIIGCPGTPGRLVFTDGAPALENPTVLAGTCLIADEWAVTNFGVSKAPAAPADYDMSQDQGWVFLLQESNDPTWDALYSSESTLFTLARNDADKSGFAIKYKPHVLGWGITIEAKSLAGLPGEIMIVPHIGGQTILLAVNWDATAGEWTVLVRRDGDAWVTKMDVVDSSPVTPALGIGVAGDVFVAFSRFGSSGTTPQNIGNHGTGLRGSIVTEAEMDKAWAIVKPVNVWGQEHGLLARTFVEDGASVVMPEFHSVMESTSGPEWTYWPDLMHKDIRGDASSGLKPTGSIGRAGQCCTGLLRSHNDRKVASLCASGTEGTVYGRGFGEYFRLLPDPISPPYPGGPSGRIDAFNTNEDKTFIMGRIQHFSKTTAVSAVDRPAMRSVSLSESASFCQMGFTKAGETLRTMGIATPAGVQLVSEVDIPPMEVVLLMCTYRHATNEVIAHMQTQTRAKTVSAPSFKANTHGISSGIQWFASTAGYNAFGYNCGFAVFDEVKDATYFDKIWKIVSVALDAGAGVDYGGTYPIIRAATANVPQALLGSISGGTGTHATKWSALSGPGPVTFLDDSDLTSNVIFPIAGTYFLQLDSIDIGNGTTQSRYVQYVVA